MGMSQTDLADSASLALRQIRRYETGEQQPVLAVAVRLADALGLTVNELAGRPPATVNLTGEWWAGWQTWNRGQEMITTQPIEIVQHGVTVRIRALDRNLQEDLGGYLWEGELRVWDNSVLTGWYSATDLNVRSRGTMFFVLHAQGLSMQGRWVGSSFDGPIVSGWGSIEKARDQASSTIERLRGSHPDA
jgi:transcriptional regulator with XRE-family HTH domain